jgi:ligand-binding sensor domain-containing protein
MRNLILSILFLSTLLSYGQNDVLFGRFVNYTVDQGLSSSRTSCVAEDSLGFIWIGTEEGLNRFDGTNFKMFLKSSKEGSIPDNYITQLIPLPKGDLLGTTRRGGVFKYCAATESFETFPTTYRDDKPLLAAISIVQETDSTFFVSYGKDVLLSGGLYRLNIRSGQQTLLSEEVLSAWGLAVGPDNTLWTCSDKLYRVDLETRATKSFKHPGLNNIENVTHEDLCFENDKILLASWGAGIVVFDPEQETFIANHLFDPEATSSNKNVVRKLHKKSANSYWVISADKGLGEFNTRTKKFSFYEHSASDPYSIFYISARDVLVDSRGIIWAAMASGLSVNNPEVLQIHYAPIFQQDEQRGRTFQFNQAMNIGNDLLVSASSSDGYWMLDLATKKNQHRIAQSGQVVGQDKGLSGVEVQVVDNRFWSMSANHLFEITPDQKTIKRLDLYERFGYEDPRGFVNTICPAPNNKVLFGTDDNLVGTYDPQTGDVEQVWLIGDAESKQDNLVFEVAVENPHRIWAATTQGVYRITDMLEVERLDSLSDAIRDMGWIEMVSLTCNGTSLALGTRDQGVVVVDLNDWRVTNYGREQGMISLYIGEMEVDGNNHYWGLTGNGLVQIDPAEKNTVNVYTERDGLMYNDIIGNEITRLSDGTIMLGLFDGIAWFHPDSLNEHRAPAFMYVRNVYRQGELVDYLLGQTIEARYKEAVEIEFAALGFTKPSEYRYAWRAVGEANWNYMQEPRLVFSELGKNDYILEIQAQSRSGEWMESPLLLSIIIEVPWYRQNWFYILVAIAIFAISLYIVRLRVINIRRTAQMQTEYNQRLAEVEMSALRAQMNPHFLFNCLNSIKFFIINNETDQASEYLTKFGRLIRLILSNSKSDTITLSTELESLQLYVVLEALRFSDKFKFELRLSPDIQADFIDIPPMLIQPFVENAIWHGLHHKQGEGLLRVDISLSGNDLICVIEDDGVGRSTAAEMKSKSATRDKSYGMDITRRRLDILESKLNKEGKVEITDLTDGNGSPTGTKVTIRIPLD